MEKTSKYISNNILNPFHHVMKKTAAAPSLCKRIFNGGQNTERSLFIRCRTFFFLICNGLSFLGTNYNAIYKYISQAMGANGPGLRYDLAFRRPCRFVYHDLSLSPIYGQGKQPRPLSTSMFIPEQTPISVVVRCTISWRHYK